MCDRPCEKVTQVGKIIFMIGLPTALAANFVDSPFFHSLDAESILESIHLLEKH